MVAGGGRNIESSNSSNSNRPKVLPSFRSSEAKGKLQAKQAASVSVVWNLRRNGRRLRKCRLNNIILGRKVNFHEIALPTYV